MLFAVRDLGETAPRDAWVCYKLSVTQAYLSRSIVSLLRGRRMASSSSACAAEPAEDSQSDLVRPCLKIKPKVLGCSSMVEQMVQTGEFLSSISSTTRTQTSNQIPLSPTRLPALTS